MPGFRTTFDSQRFKHSEKLQHRTFHHIFSSLCQKLLCKISVLVIFETLGLFVNTFTAEDKYSLRNRSFLCNQFKCHYMNMLRKNITLIGYVFPKLATAKDNVT